MTNGSQSSYRIVGELPPGDALRVERAVDERGAEVALKEVAPRDVGRFLEEMAVVGGIVDPHLERVVGQGRRGEHAYVATEIVDGVDLGQEVFPNAPLPPATVEAYGAQMASALASLHLRGIVHGGVKPSTIIVTPSGSLKLTDTGLARVQGPPDLSEEAPARAAWYVSPEEVLARPAVPASDVYSLGVVLYQLATGRLPFDGRNAFTVAEAHVDAPVTAPRLINPAVSESLENVILRCLSKAPEDRYVTATDLLHALERALEGESVQEAPVSVAAERRRPLWPWIAVAVVAVIAVVAVLWASGVFAQSVIVPDLAGMTVGKASTALTDAGLKLGTVTNQSSPGHAQGTVISQTPRAGAEVDEGSSVDLVVAGAATTAVPNLLGLTQSAGDDGDHRRRVRAGWPSPRSTTQSAPVGQVVDQAPAAGTQLLPGSQMASPCRTARRRAPAPRRAPCPTSWARHRRRR